MAILRCVVSQFMKVKKIKIILKQAMKHPDCEQIYSSSLFLTSALDVGRWLAPHPDSFTARKDT